MIRKLPLSIALAAVLGFAAPALAAETHAASHDPQVAASTAKPGTKHSAKKATHAKGRHATAAKKAKAEKHAATQTNPAAPAR